MQGLYIFWADLEHFIFQPQLHDMWTTVCTIKLSKTETFSFRIMNILKDSLLYRTSPSTPLSIDTALSNTTSDISFLVCYFSSGTVFLITTCGGRNSSHHYQQTKALEEQWGLFKEYLVKCVTCMSYLFSRVQSFFLNIGTIRDFMFGQNLLNNLRWY